MLSPKLRNDYNAVNPPEISPSMPLPLLNLWFAFMTKSTQLQKPILFYSWDIPVIIPCWIWLFISFKSACSFGFPGTVVQGFLILPWHPLVFHLPTLQFMELHSGSCKSWIYVHLVLLYLLGLVVIIVFLLPTGTALSTLQYTAQFFSGEQTYSPLHLAKLRCLRIFLDVTRTPCWIVIRHVSNLQHQGLPFEKLLLYLCACISVYHMTMQCPGRPEEDTELPGTGVADNH